MKLGIVGCTNFNDFKQFCEMLKMYYRHKDIKIIYTTSGKPGIEQLVRHYAKWYKIPVVGTNNIVELVKHCKAVIGFAHSHTCSGYQGFIKGVEGNRLSTLIGCRLTV